MSRNLALDYLRLFLAFIVVAMHEGFLHETSAVAEFLTAQGLFKLAVPIFLLINGYFFYTACESGKALAWLRRLLLIYTVWMAIYGMAWVTIAEGPFVAGYRNLFRFFIGYYHLWYIAGLLSAGVLLFLLRHAGTKLLLLLSVSLFVFGVLADYCAIYSLTGNASIDTFFYESWTHRNFLFLCFPFLCWGFLFNKLKIPGTISRSTAFSLALAGVALLLAESWLNLHAGGMPKYDGGFDNLLFVAVAAPAIFLLVMTFTATGNTHHLSSMAAGIYLLHPNIGLMLEMFLPNGTVLTLAVFAVTSVFAWLLIIVNKKLPYLL